MLLKTSVLDSLWKFLAASASVVIFGEGVGQNPYPGLCVRPSFALAIFETVAPSNAYLADKFACSNFGFFNEISSLRTFSIWRTKVWTAYEAHILRHWEDLQAVSRRSAYSMAQQPRQTQASRQMPIAHTKIVSWRSHRRRLYLSDRNRFLSNKRWPLWKDGRTELTVRI